MLWWKPDEKEELTYQEGEEPETDEDRKYRYYKPYENERFLRWFGTDHVPFIDLDRIRIKTICSIPHLSNDIQSDKFFNDSNNLTNPDFSRANNPDGESISLLSLAQKSTIELFNRDDGQYLRFVVGGHQ